MITHREGINQSMFSYRLHDTSTMYRLWNGTYLTKLPKRTFPFLKEALTPEQVVQCFYIRALQLSDCAGLEASFSHLVSGCWIDPAGVDVDVVQKPHG